MWVLVHWHEAMGTLECQRGIERGIASYIILFVWTTLLPFLCAFTLFSPLIWNPAAFCLLAWGAMTFVLRRPKEWPSFKRFMQRSFGSHVRAIWPLQLDASRFHKGIKERAKHEDPGKRPPLLFMLAPHGIVSVHTNFLIMLSGMWEAAGMPCVHMLVGTGFFVLPFYREYFTWLGASPIYPNVVREWFK